MVSLPLAPRGRDRKSRALSGLDGSGGVKPLGSADVLRRLGVLCLVAFAFAMVAVVLVNAPR
jgi:hypothetical protein